MLLDAMSQLFFSLSVSMGIMVTYGSYVKDDVDLNKSINQIEIFDTGVAFLAGMMIIPAVFVFLGTDGMASGPSLIFISLPKVFASMGAIGRIIAIAFFLMMGFAALTSCVSVMETLVANCMEIFHKSRQKMCAVIGIYSLVTAVLICLGYNVLYFEVKLPNGTVAQLLDIMDYISNSFLMPFISLLTSILIGWVVGPKLIIDEVERNGEHFKRAKLYCFMIRYASTGCDADPVSCFNRHRIRFKNASDNLFQMQNIPQKNLWDISYLYRNDEKRFVLFFERV